MLDSGIKKAGCTVQGDMRVPKSQRVMQLTGIGSVL